MNLTATRTAIWRTPPQEGATEIEEFRFTFASCSMAGSGVYYRCMRDFEAWYQEQNGQSNDDARKSKDEAQRINATRQWNQGNDYAAIMASLKSLETRVRPLTPAEGEVMPAWTPMAVPAEWQSFAGFWDDIPWSAMSGLAEAAHGANPGLWRFQDDDAAKKNGGASAS